jgi:hypothetical protein
MNTYNKGGRPKKSAVEKRTYRVNIKMSTEEYYTCKAQSLDVGVTLSEYVRLAISNSKINQRLTPEQLDHIRKLCGMANNLNQIAHKANAAGYDDARSEFLFLANKIDNLLNMLDK